MFKLQCIYKCKSFHVFKLHWFFFLLFSLLQICVLLFICLYILSHFILTHFKKNAEFVTGKFNVTPIPPGPSAVVWFHLLQSFKSHLWFTAAVLWAEQHFYSLAICWSARPDMVMPLQLPKMLCLAHNHAQIVKYHRISSVTWWMVLVFFSCKNEIFRIEESKFLIAVDSSYVTLREGSSMDEECSHEINIGPLAKHCLRFRKRTLPHVLVYTSLIELSAFSLFCYTYSQWKIWEIVF